ncbi:MFS transporter [Actinospica durhamensis]|uniref:MFS transporter n=1 Tax=Actinospica durhamensis TaxID=1508375 RepID=A0A941EUB7_9ACTN|nr:MFS transporter [Actinospica durhamensis]MBR7838262.1 MFS transporter [Actinospica durhamensis]
MTTTKTAAAPPRGIKSLVPARIDRLVWSRFHTRMVVALGVAWILDGLEVSIASNVSPYLTEPGSLGMGAGSVAFSVGTVYLLGEVFGALFFGNLSDRWGRKNLFMITLGVYLLGGGLTALTLGKGQGWVLYLDLTRFIAGAGIGGEYAAINSAIDELIPARYRGRVDIAVNGTYWAGAFIASVLTVAVIKHLPVSYNWRIAFLFGPILGLIILFVRRNLPESPRWLVMHGRVDEAEEAVERIERETLSTGGSLDPVDESKQIEVLPADSVGYWELTKTLFRRYPSRSVLGATLMITQSFLYNAIFFTYSLVLTKIYGVPAGNTAYYFMAFAIGNLCGPLLLGRLFDTIGRRRMISGTYLIAGVSLAISAFLFHAGQLTALTQTICWCFIFFFASAGASAAYLTVSEIFPVEVRAKAIAVFFAIAQCFGAFGPWFYGKLIGDTGNQSPDYLLHHSKLWIGYLIGAAVMIIGALVELWLGVDAEGRSLEDVATPLTAVGRPDEDSGPAADATGTSRPPVA